MDSTKILLPTINPKHNENVKKFEISSIKYNNNIKKYEILSSKLKISTTAKSDSESSIKDNIQLIISGLVKLLLKNIRSVSDEIYRAKKINAQIAFQFRQLHTIFSLQQNQVYKINQTEPLLEQREK